MAIGPLSISTAIPAPRLRIAPVGPDTQTARVHSVSDVISLLDRLLADDSRAWQELVRQYSPLLLAIVRKTFARYAARPTAQDCEDAVAEVWTNLLENDRRLVRQCRQKGNFLPMIQVLARNRSIDIMRKRQPSALALVESQAAAPVTTEAASEISPTAVAAAAAQLPSRQRVLINLFFLQGKKYREIAVLTGIPQNSIGPTLARALAALRKAIDA